MGTRLSVDRDGGATVSALKRLRARFERLDLGFAQTLKQALAAKKIHESKEHTVVVGAPVKPEPGVATQIVGFGERLLTAGAQEPRSGIGPA